MVTVRLSMVDPPQSHGLVSEPQLSPDARVSPSQPAAAMAEPITPQPKKSLFKSPDSRQPAWQLVPVHAAPVIVPERSAHTLQPVPETEAA